MAHIEAKYGIEIVLIILMTACYNQDRSLHELDALTECHLAMQEQYQAQLDSLDSVYQRKPMTDDERFACYGRLFDMYRSFNLKNQYVYAQKRIDLASRLANREYIRIAQMNNAEVLMRSGMYHEAILCLDSVADSPIEPVYQPYYFHLRRTLYGLMEDFAITGTEKRLYHQLTQDYRDSIIRVEQSGSFVYEMVRADAFYADGKYEEALALLDHYESAADIKDNQAGIWYITKAQIYRAMGNHSEEKRHLIISACADMRCAYREYIALRELAVLLYHDGDIDHAYHYMHMAIEDAQAGNMRSRSLEISTIYPIVEKAHLRQEAVRARMLYGLITSITLLAGMLGLFLNYSARKRRQLASLNELLKESNSHLQQSNHIKTVYVGHYMEMASALIERFDNWRKKLNQSIKSGEIQRAQTEIASQRFTQEQLNLFYHDFDEAFLTIFPDFIEKVRELLVDGTEFRMKEGEKLNTDLRVLGCIRLGITDSTQIASFLRYSLSTIYNSRTRMRNLAKGNRDDFEKNVATL